MRNCCNYTKRLYTQYDISFLKSAKKNQGIPKTWVQMYKYICTQVLGRSYFTNMIYNIIILTVLYINQPHS